MLYYAAIYCVIFLYCIVDSYSEKKNSRSYFGLLFIIVIFVGYRYNIGYDWLAYELLFDTTNQNFSWTQYNFGAITLQVEPAFYAFVLFFRWIGLDFQNFLMIISLINLVVIHSAVRRISSNNVPLFWLIYFIVAVIAIQFNIIRQALASSFVILALLAAYDRKYLRAVLVMGIAGAIHISTLMFFPFIFIGFRRVPLVAIAGGAAISLLAVLDSTALSQILSFVSSFLPNMFSQKAVGYSEALGGGAEAALSPLALLLIFGHVAVAIVVRRSDHDRWDRLAFNMSLLMLVCHIAFYSFPSLWNRALAVAIVFQIPVVLRDIHRMFGFGTIRLTSAAVFAVSLVMLYPLATRPENIAFVPYHNYLQYVLFNDPGDGRQRSEYAIRRAEQLQAR